MTHGTSFQWRLREILNGTDRLTEEEIKITEGITSVELAERVDQAFEEYIEEINEFKFGI